MRTIILDDGDVIILQRRFDGKERAHIEITDKLVPRGEQVLRTYTIIFPDRWLVLGAEGCSTNTASI